MKKLFVTLFMALSLGATVFAANEDKDHYEFNPHWFINLRGGAAYTVGETSFSKLISPTADFAFGYQFTPVWGVRGDFSGWQAKGSPSFTTGTYSFKFGQVSVDAMMDICNLFNYNSSRIFEPYLFLGAGAVAGFDNSEIKDMMNEKFTVATDVWEATKFFPAAHFGAGLNIRIVDAVRFNVEMATNLLPDKFNSKLAGNSDWQLELKAGFTFNLGKTRTKSEYVAPVEPAKPEPVKEEPAPVVEPTPEPEPAPAPVVKVCPQNSTEVYFVIGKYVLRESEKANLAKTISLAKEYEDAKILLTGYADKNTGSSKRNLYLSQKRAEAVQAYLVENGIAAERIAIDFKGDTVQPNDTPATNRVVICVVK